MLSSAATPHLTRRATLGLGVAALAGCGRARDPARVSWWAMSTAGENAPLLLPAFTAARGIAVDVQALPWTAAHAKVLTAFAGRALPDVLMVANAWLAELTMLGALQPVPPRLAAGLLPAANAAASVDGALRAVPWFVDTQVQFFRRDLLAAVGQPAPPTDWAGWQATARDLKRRRPDDFAVLLPLDWPEMLMTFAHQQPEPLLRDRASRGNFSSAGFRAAFAFYLGLFAERLAPAVNYAQVGDALTAFARGTFALLPSSAETVGDLARRPELPRDRWGIAAMPGRDGPAPGLLYGCSLAVTRDAADPDRAWALVDYLTTPATQLRFHGITGNLPSRAAAWPGLAADPAAAPFAAQLDRGVAAPAVPEWARIIVEVQQIAERTVRGEFGVDAATRLMDTRVDALLAKRRWLLDRGMAA